MTFNIETDKLKSIKVEVKSSLIDFMEYSRRDYSLTVTYKKRSVFKKKVKRFEEVSLEQFFEILNAESVGKAFMRLVDHRRTSQVY